MSILEKIQSLERGGKLTRYIPLSGVPKRCLFLAALALQDLNDPSSATNFLTGRGWVEAALTRWTSGGLVHGNQRRGLFLDRLSPPPPEIWEIRVYEPNVQSRLFGRFAAPDTLILTKFHTRSYLGSRGSKNWRDAMMACKTTWDRLFEMPPFSAGTIGEYVTENHDDFPIQTRT